MSTWKNKMLARSLLQQSEICSSATGAATPPGVDWRVVSVRDLKKIAHALASLRRSNAKLAERCNLQYKNKVRFLRRVLAKRNARIDRLRREHGPCRRQCYKRYLLSAVRRQRVVCFELGSIVAARSGDKLALCRLTASPRTDLSVCFSLVAAKYRTAAVSGNRIAFAADHHVDSFVADLKNLFRRRRQH
ncbi:ORF129 [Lymantria xylina nucleopolyhedrovirus]|uniref:ORF129 n=1 Tax=Lymantria xylina multiple nucleopolyhedrovirus TaxID=2847840 RepID=D4N2G6_9ABAC|nr:ORF129 [Lymantria xylina nucleopolyhedrovirus]ADD73838.1 ORF129 [Lymantria xylina nucleopolyhedrovirus]